MIRNNSITYDAIESPLSTWRAEDPILHAFLVAMLTTILAYQTTAILFDLLVGSKPKGKARVTDLGSVILAKESSILSAATSLFHKDILLRWRFNIIKPTYKDKDRKDFVITFPVCFKFIVLFFAAPALSLVSIVISLEGDSIVSFRDARFGGIALGIADNQSIVDLSNEDRECRRYRIAHTRHEVATASFHRCSRNFGPLPSTLNSSKLSISQIPLEEIMIRIETPEHRYQSFIRVDVRILDNIYRLNEKISLEEGKSLIRFGQKKLMEGCFGSSNDSPPIVSHNGRGWNISQLTPCPTSPTRDLVQDAVLSMSRLITVVNAKKFDIVDIELRTGLNSSSNLAEFRPTFVQGDDLPFLKRRRSYVNFAILCILVSCVLVLKIILKGLKNNDIDVGIETIMKDSLGLNCCDSMLQNRSIIDFRDESLR